MNPLRIKSNWLFFGPKSKEKYWKCNILQNSHSLLRCIVHLLLPCQLNYAYNVFQNILGGKKWNSTLLCLYIYFYLFIWILITFLSKFFLNISQEKKNIIIESQFLK